MSDQIDLESVDSQICRTFWEEYVGPKSMIVDTLGVYCIFVKSENEKKKNYKKKNIEDDF